MSKPYVTYLFWSNDLFTLDTTLVHWRTGDIEKNFTEKKKLKHLESRRKKGIRGREREERDEQPKADILSESLSPPKNNSATLNSHKSAVNSFSFSPNTPFRQSGMTIINSIIVTPSAPSILTIQYLNNLLRRMINWNKETFAA